MMGSMGLLVILFGGDLLGGTPWDLVSLIEPVAALERLEVRTDEASLIAILGQEEGVPETPLPGGDMQYVRKLLAVRALQQMKGQGAIAALQEVAGGDDVTLRVAAQEAIAAIEGKAIPRPSGLETLKQSAALVPPDAGFVIVLDFERGAKMVTVRQCFDLVKDKLEPFLGRMSEREIEEILTQAEQGIVAALASVGNVRLDSVTVAVSDDVGINEEDAYVAIMAKGLYDPDRVAGMARGLFMDEREIGGHRILYDQGEEQAIGLLDEHTFLLSTGAGPDAVDRILEGIASREQAPPPAHAARAIGLIEEKEARVAVSGALSAAQKALIREEMQRDVQRLEERQERPDTHMEIAGTQVGIGLTNVEMFEAYMAADGKLAVRATCPDADVAAQLHASLTRLEQLYREMILEELAEVPEPIPPFLKDLRDGGKLWECRLQDRRVVLRADVVRLPTLQWMQGAEAGRRFEPTAEDLEAVPAPIR